MVTGLQLYVKNAVGLPRLSIQCKCCKAKWVEESDPKIAGMTHRCPDVLTALTQKKSVSDAMLVMHQALVVAPIMWTKKGNLTKCTHSCRRAKGSSCDCECNGQNHGIAVITKAVTRV